MSTIGDLLDGLDTGDLERLAERLAPYLPTAAPPAAAVAYTPKSLAAELGRSERSVRAAIARGELQAVKRGRGWVIGAEAVQQWAAAPSPRGQQPRPRTPPAARRGRSGPGPARRALAGGSVVRPDGV